MFEPIRKYAEFEGRARRSEFWLFTLFDIILLFGWAILFGISAAISGDRAGPVAIGIGLLGVVLYLCLLIPRLAVTVRRLHDSDKSGWWILIAMLPFGGIVLLVFYCLDGTRGPNRYGPDPKGPNPAEVFS